MYSEIRDVWRWWLMAAADHAASLRASAICLTVAGKRTEAVQCLERADLIEADGPDAAGAVRQGTSQEDLKAAYAEASGVDVDDPETRAKIAAADAAIRRVERTRAEEAAVAEEKAKHKTAQARERLRRRGRK